MKKIVALMLVCIFFLSNAEFALGETTAAYTQEEQIVESQLTSSYVNPLYADDISEDDLHRTSSENRISPYAGNSYTSDINEVITSIREAMVARAETVDIYYMQYSELEEDFFGQWIDLAVEETGIPKEGDYLKWHYGGATLDGNCETYPISGLRKYSLTITFTYYTTAEQEAQMDEAILALLTELDVENESSDYKKVKKIYDYICENITYDYDNLEDTTYMLKYSAYAALINKTAVCQGYASLLYRLLKESGIDCRVIVGQANGGNHAWNLIQIEDLYYLADSTWDAGYAKYGYFLKGTTDFKYHTAESDFLSNYMIADTEYIYGFADVTEEDWYYEAVCYNLDHDLMSGMSKTTFAPLESLSRAQLALILYRMEGKPEVTYEAVFSDVPDEQWYTDAIMWAQENGIVTGYHGTDLFGTHDKILREQIAVMMYRYAQYLNCDTSESTDIASFADAQNVTPYAETAVKWAVGSGIITGKSQGTQIDPLGDAMRAECATIMMRFTEKY